MWKHCRFWQILGGLCLLSACFFMPFSPIRFGGFFLGALGCCCLVEGGLIGLAARHGWAHRFAAVGRLLFLLFCLSFAAIQGLIVSGERQDPQSEHAQYLLVLGAHILPDRPSDALIERVKTAADFLDAHPQTTAILCGGQGKNEPMPESVMMRNYMVETLGVHPDRLLVETESHNTIQNIANAKRLFRLEGKRCAVVSSDYHLARARRLMKHAGLDPYGVPAPVPNLPLNLASHMREYTSTLGLLLTGRYF